VKLAQDSHGLYDGDEFSAKAASLELAGLRAYFQDLWTGLSSRPESEPLFTPLLCTVSYCGFRMTVANLLPVSPATLKYGSSDGARTVHRDNQELNDLMDQAGRRFGLCSHPVGRTTAVELTAPADIEGHVGFDGKYYVLDTAR
jgi:Clustered mitochondria